MTRPQELVYAVRLRVIASYCGYLIVALAVLTGVPAAVALLAGDGIAALWYFGTAIGLGAVGAALARIRAPSGVQTNEALVVVAISFVLAALVMTLPFAAGGLRLEDALFEAVSGVTTTGLTTLPTVEGRSPAFLFGRAWLQWYGGLGFVVLSLALVARPGALAMRLGAFETDEQDLVGGTQVHARRILVVYGSITVAAVVGLWIAGAGVVDGVVHALAAVSTGGFTSHDASLGGFEGPAPRIVIAVFFVLCAAPLALYHRGVVQGWRQAVGDPQVRALLLAGVIVTLVLLATMPADAALSGWARLGHGALTALSAQTTAGFSTIHVGALDDGSKLTLIAAMFVGGGVGSTAGGTKLLRLLIVLRILQVTIVRTALPRHAVYEPALGGHRLRARDVEEAAAVLLVFPAVIGLSWLAFLVHGIAPLDALFEVVSATGTVGLSTGVVGPDLPTTLKLLLCGNMLLGRLEMIALLVVVAPKTWFGARRRVP